MVESDKITYKYIHFFAIIFSISVVTMGLIVDFHPGWYMNGWEKILVYVSPMLLLFFDMNVHLKYIESIERKKQLQIRTLKGIFTIYIIVLATLLFLESTFRRGFADRNIWQVVPFSKDHIKYYSNLIPLKSVTMYYTAFQKKSMSLTIITINVLGNLLAFAPFGFFIPILYKKKVQNVFKFLIIATISSTLVEVIQFLTMVGQADIDDVILNVLGALIIYILMHLPFIKRLMVRMFPYTD